MTLQRKMLAVGCGFAIVSSFAALAVATGVNSIDNSVAKGLPSVVSAWRMPADRVAEIDTAKLSTVALHGAVTPLGGPVAGDEGYWLDAKALAGGDGASLSVGQRMTIADHTYVISELRPMPAEAVDAENKAGGRLTLVVAREANSDSAQPRTLRFLIEGTQAVPPAATTASATSHRSL